ncbi:MAG: anti-sigma factor family protein [Vulcanimicrobiaceae bacterium]
MRCSSCEPLLDRYVEGTLPARQMRAIGAHVRDCAACSALLTELKVVDALLVTTRATEPAVNFTFAVMAEVRSMPFPRKRQHPAIGFLSLYLAAAWVAAVVVIAATGTSVPAIVVALTQGLSHFGNALASLMGNGAQAVGHSAPSLAVFGITVLAIDVAVAIGFGLLYVVVRPRVAARLASRPEVS